MTDVVVVAELLEGKPKKATHVAVSFAKQVAGGTSAYDILVIGEGAKGAAGELTGLGARKVLTAEIGGGYFAEKYAPTVARVAKDGDYGAVVATATSFGKDLIPRVAGRLGAGYAGDIIGVSIDGGKPKYRRSMYAGNVRGTLTLTTPVHCVTLRQSEFEPVAPGAGSSPVEDVAVVTEDVAKKIEFLSQEVVKSERPELTEADIVVSGGRALKSSDNFVNVLEPLVDAFGAAMGASRAACDAGYVPNDLQVGQTGKVVAPNLYVAVGISGAIQHLAGMKGSKTIVAINKDKEAPIAQVADYFLVADLFEAVPALTAELKKLKASG